MEEIKTQKDRIDQGRPKFNKVLLENSSSDDLYQAILEWKFAYSIDVYGNFDDDYIDDIREIIASNGHPELADTISVNVYNISKGQCICGKNDLSRVYYIKNIYNGTVLPTGSECVKKTFKDGSITETIKFLDKCFNKHKDFYKKKYKNLEKQYKKLEEKYKELEEKYRKSGSIQEEIFTLIKKQRNTYKWCN